LSSIGERISGKTKPSGQDTRVYPSEAITGRGVILKKRSAADKDFWEAGFLALYNRNTFDKKYVWHYARGGVNYADRRFY